MARSIPKQTRTQADELRELLDACYTTAVNIRGAGAEQAQTLLTNLDHIQALFSELEALEVDLRAERGRWQEVQGAVRRHASDLRAELASAGGLKTLRQSLPAPPAAETQWWWWLDAIAHRNIRRRVLTTLAILAGIALLLAAGIWGFNQLFPVDPQVSAAYEHKVNAENAITEGRLKDAIAELEQAAAAMPDDPEILTTLAALYDLTDQEDRALPLLQRMHEHYPPSIVDANLAQAYVAAGDAEKALPLALQAIDEDPANPQGYLIAGMVYEAKGDIHRASEYYQKAADAANAAKDYQTEAFAKIRLATVLQKPPIPTPSGGS